MKRMGTTEKRPEALTISPELASVQSLMPMSGEDLERLREDIKKNGIRHPVIVYQDKGELRVLAGWHRRRIAIDLKIPLPVEIVEASPRERREFVIKENLARRHLSASQKQKLIEHLLENDPGASSRKIAAALGVHHSTVEKRRDQVAKLATCKRQGRDGKSYRKPAKPPKKAPHYAQEPPGRALSGGAMVKYPGEKERLTGAEIANGILSGQFDDSDLQRIVDAAIPELIKLTPRAHRPSLIARIKALLKP